MVARWRQSLALWAAGGAALLLLLLARLPPPAANTTPTVTRGAHTTDRERAALVSSSNAPLANVTSSARAVLADKSEDKPAETLSGNPADNPAVNPAGNPAGDPAASPAQKLVDTSVSNTQQVVYTKDLYVGSHSVPHPELCPQLGARVRVLVLVTSHPAHRAARDAVRLTWGHAALRADTALAFVIGTPPATLTASLEEEDGVYGDIIVGNSVDSYSNLTLKTLSMLEWADTYCPRARFLLKTDDDMFINVPRLLQFVNGGDRVNATKTIYGKVLKKSLPKRIPKSKYYLPRAQFPGRVFPDFTTGPAYLLTRDSVRPLLDAAPQQPYIRLEDVFVTGVVAGIVGVRRQHAKEFYNKKISPHPCAVRRGISIHMVRYHEQFDLWRKLLDNTAKCS